MALSVSERPSTAVARSVGHFGGADILKIPENYDDDLASKIEVKDTTRANWQRLGIMVECSAGGEFLRACSVPFDGRSFFEVIERQGGYDDYCATDAPVQLAALAQRHGPQPTQTP